MGRLADMIHEGEVYFPAWCGGITEAESKLWAKFANDTIAHIGDYPLIVADNVGEFYFAENAKDQWDIRTDFPSCVPPFPRCFIEVSRPSRVLTGKAVIPASNFPKRWGWDFRCEDVSAMTVDECVENLRAERENKTRIVERILDLQSRGLASVDVDKIKSVIADGSEESFQSLNDYERTIVASAAILKGSQGDLRATAQEYLRKTSNRWVISAALYTESDKAIGPLCRFHLAADSKGVIRNLPQYAIVGETGTEVPANRLVLYNTFIEMLHPILLAVSFMNCKNTDLKQKSGATPELNKARARRGKKPFLRYHVIEIEPMRQVLRTEGQSETSGLKRALHICRGHFATYDERPLFGRVKGTFWIPAHVRGSKQAGTVVKDYSVQRPVSQP